MAALRFVTVFRCGSCMKSIWVNTVRRHIFLPYERNGQRISGFPSVPCAGPLMCSAGSGQWNQSTESEPAYARPVSKLPISQHLPSGANLALFFQVFELIILSCEEAACATFLRLTPDEEKQPALQAGRKPALRQMCIFTVAHSPFVSQCTAPIKGAAISIQKYTGFSLGLSIKDFP